MDQHTRALRPPGPLRPLQFLRRLQANFISVWPDEAYARPVTRVRIGRRPMFTANTPALAKHVLLENAANYGKSPIAKRLFRPALGDGLLTSDGETWKRHRQLVAPSFVARHVNGFIPAMVAETEELCRRWERTPGPIDLSRALSDLTLAIMTTAMFGAESRADVATLVEASERYQKALRPSLLDFLGAPDWIPRRGEREARALAGGLTDSIHRMVARRSARTDPPDDLLTHLVAARDDGRATLTEIRDEIATIFTAGHETTAATLAWTFALLDANPDVEQALRHEVRTVLAGRAPTDADIPQLRLTRAVIDETLRLYPPAHTMTRLALGPDRLGDVAVPKGAVVLISPWLLGRNPTLWPDPERFDPSRAAPSDRYAYIPFGAGPRVCLGASFAITEAVIVLAVLLQRWLVVLVPGQMIEPVALITLRPRHSLQAIPEACELTTTPAGPEQSRDLPSNRAPPTPTASSSSASRRASSSCRPPPAPSPR